MYIAPSSGETLANLNLPLKWILRRFEVVFDVWSENAALFTRLIRIHSNPPIHYTMALRLSTPIYHDTTTSATCID